MDFDAARKAMVDSQLRPSDVFEPRVWGAMGQVAREAFVPTVHKAVAYADRAIPLTSGRVLNPPLAIGLLLDRLALTADDRLLLIGVGTGYAAAVAARLVGSVVALEEEGDLAAQARDNLAGVAGVEMVVGPLDKGWAPGAPYDAILIDGAVEAIPDALIDQLADGGRLAAGLDERGVTRLALGRKTGHAFGMAAFVDSDIAPLTAFAQAKAWQF